MHLIAKLPILQRMRFILVIGVFCVAVVLGYGHSNESRLVRADPGTLASNAALMNFALRRGAPLYAAHCAVCHGDRGTGDTVRGIPNLTDADWLYGEGTVSDIEQTITYGIRSDNPKGWNLALMPAYAQAQPSPTEPKIPPLRPGDIRDVVEFLRYAQKRDADSDAVARGAAIFAGVGGCWDCHGADAKGDPAIGAPNLADRITLYGDGGRNALFRSIAQGHHGMCPAWIDQMSSANIREISVYVYSLSHHHPAGAAEAD